MLRTVSSKRGTDTLAAIVCPYSQGADSGRLWYVKIFAVFPLQGLIPVPNPTAKIFVDSWR
jgi:hypothetical protein